MSVPEQPTRVDGTYGSTIDAPTGIPAHGPVVCMRAADLEAGMRVRHPLTGDVVAVQSVRRSMRHAFGRNPIVAVAAFLGGRDELALYADETVDTYPEATP